MTKILMTVFVMMTSTIVVGSWAARGSHASLSRKDALGGRVELAGAYMPAMADARKLMAESCNGGGYRATEAGNAMEFRCEAAAPLASAELALRTR